MALMTTSTETINKTNQVMYAAATVVLRMLGYKMNSSSWKKQEKPPWKRRLENKISNKEGG